MMSNVDGREILQRLQADPHLKGSRRRMLGADEPELAHPCAAAYLRKPIRAPSSWPA